MTTMINHFHNVRASEEDLRLVADALALSQGKPVVSCDINIVRSLMAGAANYVLLEGTGEGAERFPKALEDAARQYAGIGEGYDLFTAEGVMVHIVTNEERPLLMGELTAVSTFSKKFAGDVCPLISVSVDDETIEGDKVVVRLLATNLKRVTV